MQIKLTLIIISLFLVISSIGTVTASLSPQVIIEDTPEETIIPDETINTLNDTESNPANETSEALTDITLIVKTTTSIETSTLDLTEHTEITTNISDLSEINISEKNPTETVSAITEPITTSVTEPVNTVPESTAPISEPEIPSAALASGIFMVIGGLMLPKKQ